MTRHDAGKCSQTAGVPFAPFELPFILMSARHTQTPTHPHAHQPTPTHTHISCQIWNYLTSAMGISILHKYAHNKLIQIMLLKRVVKSMDFVWANTRHSVWDSKRRSEKGKMPFVEIKYNSKIKRVYGRFINFIWLSSGKICQCGWTLSAFER